MDFHLEEDYPRSKHIIVACDYCESIHVEEDGLDSDKVKNKSFCSEECAEQYDEQYDEEYEDE